MASERTRSSRLKWWPEDPLPEHPVCILPLSLHGRWLQLGDWDGVEREYLPDEFALRELPRLDLKNEEALLELLVAHGPVTNRLTPFLRSRLREEFRPPVRLKKDMSVHMKDVLGWVRGARASVHHWVDSHQGEDPAKSWSSEGFRVFDEISAEHLLVDFVGQALAPYHPRVEFSRGDVMSPPLGAPRPDLAAGLFLQIFNMWVDDLGPSKCDNEGCGRMFLRKQGPSQTGRRRSAGVKYCSDRCAQSQAQRMYRRRQKADSGE